LLRITHGSEPRRIKGARGGTVNEGTTYGKILEDQSHVFLLDINTMLTEVGLLNHGHIANGESL